MELKEKLVRLRKLNRLSQLELAEKLNVSRQAISKWEVGATIPSIENLRALSGLYDVPIDYLLTSCCADMDVATPKINDIVSPTKEEDLKREYPPPSTQESRINWKYIAVFTVSLLFFIIVIFFSVSQKISTNNSALSVDEMQTDNWSISNSENFSVKW